MWGDRDSYVLRAAQDRLLEVMPRARFIAYQGFGHAFHWEDPEQFTKDLVPFLTSRTGRDSLGAEEHSPIASTATQQADLVGRLQRHACATCFVTRLIVHDPTGISAAGPIKGGAFTTTRSGRACTVRG